MNKSAVAYLCKSNRRITSPSINLFIPVSSRNSSNITGNEDAGTLARIGALRVRSPCAFGHLSLFNKNKRKLWQRSFGQPHLIVTTTVGVRSIIPIVKLLLRARMYFPQMKTLSKT